MKLILQFIKPYRKQIIFVVLAMILDVAGGLLIPTITADIINNGIGGGSLPYIIRQGILMAAVSLFASLGALAGSYFCSDLAARLGRDIRNAVYDKSLLFSDSDLEKFGTASMITRTLSDINIIQQSVIMFIQMILPVPAVCALGIIMAFLVDPFMGWILSGVTAVLLLMTIIVMKIAAPLFERLQSLLDRMNVVIRENITGVRVIRAFGKEAYEEDRMNMAFGDYRDSSVKANRLFAGLESSALLIINLIIVALLFAGGNRTGSGFIRMGDITALIEYAILILFYVIMAQFVLIMLPRASVCARRIQEVLDTEPEITDNVSTVPSPSSAAEDVIRLQNVSFRFADADEDTLHNISFHCRRGQTTAIVGSTGCGKSTIAKLILRFHDVTSGRILLDGTDIRELPQHELRNRISYVPQKSWLFSGTIAENLKHGCSDTDEEQMQKILACSQADFVNSLPGGLSYRASQGGTNFSGGQRQRLSIARALMKPAELYIFDDSFSALDFKTDAALRKALQKETKDSAVLIIAQRISTIMHADQIIVLENGKIAGSGTHRQLLDNCRIYREIAESQMKGETLYG